MWCYCGHELGNTMRNLYAFIKEEFEEEIILRLWLWGKIENKMADYRNHRRFLSKCLKQEAEKQLLNECIRSINNMIEMYMYKRDTYFHQLEGVLDQKTHEECQSFIKRVVECRHRRVLDRQKAKFEGLQQKRTSGHSNKDVQENSTIYDSNNTTEDRRNGSKIFPAHLWPRTRRFYYLMGQSL